ncbi:MAG TPA: NTP transferase domain-containing protein, partial [Actinomycetota bacterium]
MAKLRAVVLAAGRGTRMGGGTPKTLLPIDGNEPLLHYILEG